MISGETELISQVGVDVVGIRRNRQADKQAQRHVAEQSVNYILDYFQEQQITPGTWVSIHDTVIANYDYGHESSQLIEIEERLLGEHASILDLAKENIPLLTQEMVNLPRVAFDIEVRSPRDVFPVPEKAEFQVHAVATYDYRKQAVQYVLSLTPSEAELAEVEDVLGYRPQIKAFLDERDLLQTLFDDLIKYPMIISFNGDGFDLKYLRQRALDLGLEPPIFERHYRGELKEYHFKNSIHFDLFKFFQKGAIRLYAFGGKYSRNSLDAIADALLGTKKIEHDLWFDEMSLVQMISYNVQDAKITYDLTAFSNHLTMHLIFTLMRIIKGTMSFINRGTISSWILNWIAFEHRKQKVLLPKSSEIIQKKGGYQSVAASGGKQYQGAIVLDPVPGTWWNVAVMDYTSLYPSVIEKYKLSYETMKCDHVSCRSNIVPGLKHWVCEISPGIMSSLVGYVREVRVRWFKPLTKSDDQQVATLANTIQAALKVLINASYGVFGNKKFVSHCPPVAESTTAYARHALRGAQEQAEAMGIKVLAGDTDSIFLHNMTKEQEMKLRIWSMVHLGIELGVDYHFRFLVLSNRKKNYFGITTDGKIITKGLQVKKSNTARFIRTTYDAITSMLSEVSSPDELENAKKTMVNLLQRRVLEIKESSISLDDLAQLTSMKKPFKDYQTNSQAVQIAVQNLRDNKHTDIGQGSQWLTVKVKKFRYTTRTSKFYFLPSGTDIFCTIKEVAKVKNLGEVDTKHYVEALENAFKPIFESFDIDWDDTMNGYADVTEYF